jgi:hypothetical protein
MASAHCLASGGAIYGVAMVGGKERVVVTLQGEGVALYSTQTQVGRVQPIAHPLP